MTRILALIALGILLGAGSPDAADVKPLKAVMFVGGGFHDYKTMPKVLAGEIEALANVSIDVTVKMMPTATPLLTAKSPLSGKVHTVAWVNTFANAKVFGTTLGHDMKTGGDPEYHKLLAYGILWVCGKLGDDGKPIDGYAGSGTSPTTQASGADR